MYANSTLETDLQELIELKKGPGTIPEAVIEHHLLHKVFRQTLEYGDTRALRDHTDNYGGWIDIFLKPNAQTRIVVEVKQFGLVSIASIQQAASYVLNIGAEYGIVTDGLT